MAALDAFPIDIRARFERIFVMIEASSIELMREPYGKHLHGPVWEMRMKGRDGIARLAGRGGAHFRQEDKENPAPRYRDRPEASKGSDMTRQYIPAGEAFEKWRKDLEYVSAYDALGNEFALASALIKARGDAELTQEQVAEAMGTTQAFVARLESGRGLPSTRTLERFAKATRTRLRISFEPETPMRNQIKEKGWG